jgi:hypothetical protein
MDGDAWHVQLVVSGDAQLLTALTQACPMPVQRRSDSHQSSLFGKVFKRSPTAQGIFYSMKQCAKKGLLARLDCILPKRHVDVCVEAQDDGPKRQNAGHDQLQLRRVGQVTRCAIGENSQRPSSKRLTHICACQRMQHHKLHCLSSQGHR